MTSLTFKLHDAEQAACVENPPPRLARQLALAYLIEQLVEDGALESYAQAAQRLGITRARVSQIIGLLLLPLARQEEILLGRVVNSERGLRSSLSRRSLLDPKP